MPTLVSSYVCLRVWTFLAAGLRALAFYAWLGYNWQWLGWSLILDSWLGDKSVLTYWTRSPVGFAAKNNLVVDDRQEWGIFRLVGLSGLNKNVRVLPPLPPSHDYLHQRPTSFAVFHDQRSAAALGLAKCTALIKHIRLHEARDQWSAISWTYKFKFQH